MATKKKATSAGKKATPTRSRAHRSSTVKPATSSKSPSAKSPSAKRASTKSSKPKKKTKASVADAEVTIDRRRKDRFSEDGAAAGAARGEVQLQKRKKVNRRRQIDPTTCERDYTGEEVEFMNALDQYKRQNGRMFPTCSEVLEVIRTLGYVKLSAVEKAALAASDTSAEVGLTDDEDFEETFSHELDGALGEELDVVATAG